MRATSLIRLAATAFGFVCLVVVEFIAIVAVLTAGAYPAKADPVSRTAANYASLHAGSVCNIIALDPSVATVETLVVVAVKDGLTGFQAGEAIGLSVYAVCPEYGYVLDAYIAKWSVQPTPYMAGVKIGGVIR